MRNHKPESNPKVIDLHDLEGRRFWAAILAMIGLVMAVYGLGTLLTTVDKALDQVDELSERVERLSAPPASSSEPTKT